jgi:hypothetical protein
METKIDYYWYEDFERNVIIGVRGVGNEIKVNKWDIMRAEDSFRLRNGRSWTDMEALKWAFKWAEIESEYIDFEEVPNKVLLLPEPRQTKPN